MNSCYSVGSKQADTEAVVRAVAGTNTPTVIDGDLPIFQVKRGDRWFRVVNLVDERQREAKKRAIAVAHESETGGDIDVIIALGMLKEGANWRWADREIIVGHRGSLTEIIQMIGRLFRDVRGKRHVETFHLLPFGFDQTDRSAVRNQLNDYLKAILLSMLLENVLDPAYSPRRDVDGLGAGSKRRRIDYMKDALGDDHCFVSVLSDITNQVQEALAGTFGAKDSRLHRHGFQNIVSDVLSRHGVSDYHDHIGDQLWRMFNRRTARLNGLNVDHVNVDLVKENPFGCLLRYASICGAKTFQELRSITGRHAYRPFLDARAFVRTLGLKSQTEWQQYCRNGKPPDIPANPRDVYRNEGWVSFSDWLGTSGPRFRSLARARAFVQTLKLRSKTQWFAWSRSGERPTDIPAKPFKVYRGRGWNGWSDWLGTGRKRRRYAGLSIRPFHAAREFVRSLKLRLQRDWEVYCESGELPDDIPAYPAYAYRKSGWSGFPDWLGKTKHQRRKNATPRLDRVDFERN